MSKQPKLVLRESAVWDMTKHLPTGSFVEMGAGTGHMASLFLERGFHGTCHDLGESSREMIRKRFAHCTEKIQVVDDLRELSRNAYDYLLAFEVLEHIEEDQKVLKEWLEYLKPGGVAIFSVPAHQRKYGRSDEIVGHVRRYEKSYFHALLQAAGLQDIQIINYGYPITELTRSLSNRMIKNEKSYDILDQQQRSILSAQSQPQTIQKTLSLVSGRIVSPFRHVQRWFYSRDLGDGLIATARKPA